MTGRGTVPLLLAALAVLPAACRSGPPRLSLPTASAPRTGAGFAADCAGLSLEQREQLLWRAFTAGEMPPFLGALVPVTVRAQIGGRSREATFWCTPDYLGFGRDGDWLRMPMTPLLAQRIADRLDCVLPTRAMSDAIWRAAPVQLEPVTFHPKDHDILSVAIFAEQHRRIEQQRGTAPPGMLTAGIKKDVVIAAGMASAPGRVWIYGWHRPDGTPIQPLSKAHTFPHVDYSHGIRLVALAMTVDGLATTVEAVLADPALCVLLSDEGPLQVTRYAPVSAR